MIRSQQGNLLLGGEIFQLFGGNYCADKACSGISCGFAASRRTRHNNLLGSTIVRDDDDGIDNSFDFGCSQKGSDLTENSAKFALYTGMASRLFINIFLQVQVDGPGLCEQAVCDSPFGYYCTIIAVQPPVPSDSC